MIGLQAYEFPIAARADVEAACRAATNCARACELTALAVAEVQLICSELATNMLVHAKEGTLRVAAVADETRRGVRIEAVDSGPGIADIGLALTEGYTTAGSLGQGLPLARRLATDFELQSTPEGTQVVATKWS